MENLSTFASVDFAKNVAFCPTCKQKTRFKDHKSAHNIHCKYCHELLLLWDKQKNEVSLVEAQRLAVKRYYQKYR